MRLNPLTAVAAAAVAVGGLAIGAWFAVATGDGLAECREGGGTVGADIGGPFELVRPDGESVSADALIDRPTLIYFGYTFCPDFCPLDASAMAQAHDILAEQGVDAKIVFVTIDPERDTPARLGEFADAVHPDLVALSGSAEQVAAAARAYRVYYAKADDDPEFYLMDHSTFTYLMAPEAGFLDFFRHGTPPEEIAARVACYDAAL